VIEFTVPDHGRIAEAAAAIKPIGEGEPHADPETGVVSVGVGARGSDALIEAVRALDAAGVASHGLALRRPSLDDVFLALTGHGAEDEQPNGRRRGSRGRLRAEGAEQGGPEGRSPREKAAREAS
jgi:ABC-2 type transport system ATP-binding protein